MIKHDHFVVDLETLGNGPRAAIVAIGIVFIARGQISDTFYTRVNAESAAASGGEIDASTVTWWLKQSAQARKEIDGSQGAPHLVHALERVAEFMHLCLPNASLRNVWGNGSSFDNVILREAFKANDMVIPWAFWNDRDLRTITALYPEAKQLPFEGTKHHALHDAVHEAKVLIAALQFHQTLQVGALA
ncbi:3'-5' exonuclease [uncultured Pseudomonas sp.]|uniref:3'-5' exonuclease n=1 Tax=uncultured Pseudomonas sp. TaxID=114707 RepID=UPI0025CC3E54|nr:3'-5' exonuclease [uncultured Pseudomonas sp.]